MNQRSLARKVLTLVAVFAFAGVAFWLVTKPRVMSGTKTFFYTAPTKASPGGSAPAKTTSTTTSAASTTPQP